MHRIDRSIGARRRLYVQLDRIGFAVLELPILELKQKRVSIDIDRNPFFEKQCGREDLNLHGK